MVKTKLNDLIDFIQFGYTIYTSELIKPKHPIVLQFLYSGSYRVLDGPKLITDTEDPNEAVNAYNKLIEKYQKKG